VYFSGGLNAGENEDAEGTSFCEREKSLNAARKRTKEDPEERGERERNMRGYTDTRQTRRLRRPQNEKERKKERERERERARERRSAIAGWKLVIRNALNS